MPAIAKIAAVAWIAVGQQHLAFVALRFDTDLVDGQNVGPVEEIGDAAEPFGFTLGAIVSARTVETHQRGVGRRIELRLDFKHETFAGSAAWRLSVRQASPHMIRPAHPRPSIFRLTSFKPVSIEDQRRASRCAIPAFDASTLRQRVYWSGLSRNIQFRGGDQPVARAIVF
jgi:hypothetical protein